MLECALRNDKRINLSTLKAERDQSLDHSRRKLPLNNSQDFGFGCGRLYAEPFTNLNIRGIHVASSFYIMPQSNRQTVGQNLNRNRNMMLRKDMEPGSPCSVDAPCGIRRRI